jgi:hypothetical protein
MEQRIEKGMEQRIEKGTEQRIEKGTEQRIEKGTDWQKRLLYSSWLAGGGRAGWSER